VAENIPKMLQEAVEQKKRVKAEALAILDVAIENATEHTTRPPVDMLVYASEKISFESHNPLHPDSLREARYAVFETVRRAYQFRGQIDETHNDFLRRWVSECSVSWMEIAVMFKLARRWLAK